MSGLDISAVNNDQTLYNQEGLNLDETPPEQQRMKRKFFNAELEAKTAEIQAQFDELYQELEEQREQVDQEAFYDELNKLNYDGVDRFDSSPTKRLVKHHKHTVEHKGKFLQEHQHASKLGV